MSPHVTGCPINESSADGGRLTLLLPRLESDVLARHTLGTPAMLHQILGSIWATWASAGDSIKFDLLLRHQCESQKQIANCGNHYEIWVNIVLFMFNTDFVWNMLPASFMIVIRT